MKTTKITARIIFAAVCLLIAANFVMAQDEEEPTARSITSLDFQSKHPSSASGSVKGALTTGEKTPAKKTNKTAPTAQVKRRYGLVKRVPRKEPAVKASQSKVPAPMKNVRQPALKTEELGVTFWRLRRPGANETDIATFPVTINNKPEDWAAERVASTTTFKKGDRVRFTIEASRSGYLYIVNREVYTDGTTGEANIIFPTLRTRGGDNRVKAGSLIEIPSSEESVSYFTIKSLRDDYAGEEIIILILPDELPGFEIGLRAQSFSSEKLANWFADWESLVDIYDAEDGEGIVYTEIEAQTAKVATRALTQEEPLPQTIYKVIPGCVNKQDCFCRG